MFEWFQHDFMVQALLACTAMGLILAYLGIHVVGRGIVFVDLGLGQISSMGVAFAGYIGGNPVVWSVLFTLIGAGIFSALRVHDRRLRLEALIGIFYAISSALTVLLIAKTPHGDADVQDVLFGNVLAITPRELHWMLLVFGGVALVHAVLGKQFFALTYIKGHGHALSFRDHAMNLVFYTLLALAIVFAIRAGGVIPVFSYLIVPPVVAILITRNNKAVVVLALFVAALASFLGVHFSYTYDLPAGASIVTALGILTALAGGLAFLRRSFGDQEKRSAAVVVLLLLAGMASLRGTGWAQEASGAQTTSKLEQLEQQVEQLQQALEQATARIAALEEQMQTAVAPTPTPPPSVAPMPAQLEPTVATSTTGPGLKLIDIALDGLFAAGASSVPEQELRLLEGGGHDPKNRGTTLQNLELTLSGAVDPYLRGDANIVMQIDEQGESQLEVEEAYLTTLGLPAGLQVKAGTFFSPFGRLNPTHPHTWGFADQPLINSRIFGPDGLRGPGAQLSWLLPTPFFAEATFALQNANGETAVSFRSSPGEEIAGRVLGEHPVRSPADLLHVGRLSASFDPTRSFTILSGLSYAGGPNATGPEARTEVYGVDFYGKWKPVVNNHGWPFVSVQSEYMKRRFDLAEQLVDGALLPSADLLDRGGYLETQWGFKRRWVAGARFDWVDGNGDNAGDPMRDFRRRFAPNITFFPSEFSKVRLQYNWDRADHLDKNASSLFLQFEYLYGAHGAHKF